MFPKSKNPRSFVADPFRVGVSFKDSGSGQPSFSIFCGGVRDLTRGFKIELSQIQKSSNFCN